MFTWFRAKKKKRSWRMAKASLDLTRPFKFGHGECGHAELWRRRMWLMANVAMANAAAKAAMAVAVAVV